MKTEFDKTQHADGALRLLEELYQYCMAHDLPLAAMLVTKRTDDGDGGVDEESYTCGHGAFYELSPAMQAFNLVSHLPEDVQTIAVAHLLTIQQAAIDRDSHNAAMLN